MDSNATSISIWGQEDALCAVLLLSCWYSLYFYQLFSLGWFPFSLESCCHLHVHSLILILHILQMWSQPLSYQLSPNEAIPLQYARQTQKSHLISDSHVQLNDCPTDPYVQKIPNLLHPYPGWAGYWGCLIKQQHFHGCSNQSQDLKGIPGSAVLFPSLRLVDLIDVNFGPALQSTCLAVIFFERVILKCFKLDFGASFSPSNNLLTPLTPSRFLHSKSYLVSTLVRLLWVPKLFHCYPTPPSHHTLDLGSANFSSSVSLNFHPDSLLSILTKESIVLKRHSY